MFRRWRRRRAAVAISDLRFLRAQRQQTSQQHQRCGKRHLLGSGNEFNLKGYRDIEAGIDEVYGKKSSLFITLYIPCTGNDFSSLVIYEIVRHLINVRTMFNGKTLG